MGLKVFIDDIRTLNPEKYPGDYVYLRNSNDALAWFARWWMSPYPEEIEEIWFDHDLGGEDTSVVVAKFMVMMYNFSVNCFQLVPPVKNVIIHTANPVGAQNLRDILVYFNPIIMPISGNDLD